MLICIGEDQRVGQERPLRALNQVTGAHGPQSSRPGAGEFRGPSSIGIYSFLYGLYGFSETETGLHSALRTEAADPWAARRGITGIVPFYLTTRAIMLYNWLACKLLTE